MNCVVCLTVPRPWRGRVRDATEPRNASLEFRDHRSCFHTCIFIFALLHLLCAANMDNLENTDLTPIPFSCISVFPPAIPLRQRKTINAVGAGSQVQRITAEACDHTINLSVCLSIHIICLDCLLLAISRAGQSWCAPGQHRTDTHVTHATLQQPRARLEGHIIPLYY